LKKVQWAWKKTYFEKTKSKHIHLVDTESGKIVDFDDEDIIWNIKLPNWFKAEDFDIKIFGRFN
jgi:Fe2+ or Zn2+ uptake regulation protein